MKPWKFIYVTDMQPGSPRSYRFNPAWMENWQTARKQIIALEPEFMLIGGDVTRDGSIHKWELEAIKDDFDSMDIPYHVIPGNMDTGNKHTQKQGPDASRDDVSLNITSEQLKQFESVFGPSKWSFVHKNVRVSGFCDMLLGSGLPEEEELWDWLESQKKQPKAEHHLWLMHYALFVERLSEPTWDITRPEQYFEWYFGIDESHRRRLWELFKATAATRVVTGHIHCHKEFVEDGIHFDLAPATCGLQWTDKWPDADTRIGFLEYTVHGRKMSKRLVPLEKVSTRTDGYGPGGHPKPEQRDYSLAWEK